jgi:DNA polymerase I-like protein with 3'-5' exonuclease and polymerase domains
MMDVSDGFDVRGRILRDGELAPWLAENSLGNRFGLAVAGRDDGHRSKAVALAIVAADGDGRYLDIEALTDDDAAALSSWLADPGPPKAVHDGKWTMHALANRGWTLRGVTSDTALAAHLVRPGRRSPALNDLLVHHMRCALPDETQDAAVFSRPPDERAVRALILRACAVLDLADVLDEELARIDCSALLERVELPVQRVLAGLEAVGVAVEPATAPDGRIHATYHHTTSATGAVSSSDPNLRSIGTRFIAGDGYAGLLTARYEALERRVLAHLSGDARIVEARSADPHRLRTVSRALAYRWGIDEVAATLKISRQEAKSLVLRHLSNLAHGDLAGPVEEARERGYAATLSGRRRSLPDLNSPDPALRQAAEHAACATVLQGGVADIIKTAVVDVEQAIEAAGFATRMVALIDDLMVFEVAAGERDAVADHLRDRMACVYPLDLPLHVTVGD